MKPAPHVRVIPSFLWQDEPIGYTVKEVQPGLYVYEYVTLKRGPVTLVTDQESATV